MPYVYVGETIIGYMDDNDAKPLIEMGDSCDELDIVRMNVIAHPLNGYDEYITDVTLHINFMKKART